MFKFFSKVNLLIFKCKTKNVKAKIVKSGTKYFFQIKDIPTETTFNSVKDAVDNEVGSFNTYQECFASLKECWKNHFAEYPFD